MSVAELVLAIPFLFVSTLAYSNMAYSGRTKFWDNFGSITSILGNMFLNSLGLMVAVISMGLAFFYFSILILLIVIYTYGGISLKREDFNKKLLKFLLFLAVILIGGIIPLIFG